MSALERHNRRERARLAALTARQLDDERAQEKETRTPRVITPKLVEAVHVTTEALIIFWDASTEDASAAVSRFVNGQTDITTDVVREALESAGFDDEQYVSRTIAVLLGVSN